jgi:hypothetical protein
VVSTGIPVRRSRHDESRGAVVIAVQVSPMNWLSARTPAEPSSVPLQRWKAVAVAVATTAATLWFRLSIDDLLGGRPTLVIFTIPIMISAYLGGLWGGLVATALTYVGAP